MQKNKLPYGKMTNNHPDFLILSLCISILTSKQTSGG